MKKLNLFFVFFASFIYMEFLYKILIYKNIFRVSILNMLLFLVPLSIILSIITNLSKKIIVNKIVFISFTSIITIWFCAEYIIKSYFDFYLSLSIFQIADQVGYFAFLGFDVIIKRLPQIILFFLPLILSIFINKRLNFEKYILKKNLILFSICLGFYGIYLISLNIEKNKDYSSFKLYYKVNDVALNMENFGILNTFFIDIKRVVFGFHENVSIDNNELNDNTLTEYDYNNLSINFESLVQNENNDNIKKIHEYFKNDTGTLKNEYTEYFKGKNLILFMAESFNEIAVNKEITPTLYKLVNSGFVFENFYTPTIYSTIGGEFQELTSLYAESANLLYKFREGNIYFPEGIATKFKEMDYDTYAYHNNSYKFQDRNKYLKSLGFDNFKACYNGLEEFINCKKWPQSDTEMIENTINDYINQDNFMVFYATVSGHAPYDWENASSSSHKEEYMSFGFNYSLGPASYLASQMELDKAIELLIKKLDEAGKLENTVIALVGDHYPYELSIDEINEISSYKKDDRVLVNKSNFILWNSEMNTVKINKVGSQLDVIPTIYNVFGINYDSRLLIGKDILSTEGGLAIFADRSWVTDKGIYYAGSHKFIPVIGETYDEDYVKKINQLVNNKIIMSKLIIDNNYYSKVF